MKRKEIVVRAIERRCPPRIPINYFNRDCEHSDTVATGFNPPRGFTPSEPGMTEWGYAWQSLDNTMGQPGTHPLADDQAIDRYQPPDPAAPGRLDHLADFVAANNDRFIKFGLGITGFNAATFLRGFEPFLLDLYADPALAARVLDMVFDFENSIIDQVSASGVDAVAFGDDWGTQKGLIISPNLWREIFRPRYAQQFARIHRAGKKVWFHSCGDISAIIGDFIEIGVDVLELLQPDIFGIETLGEKYGGKVCFCCAVDHQRRAICGTQAEILAYARLLKERLGCFNGGFIAYIEDYASLGMSEQNYQWIRSAFHGLNERAS